MPFLPDFQNIPQNPLNIPKKEVLRGPEYSKDVENFRTLVDLNQDVFRYGLHQKYDKSLSDYEDPTYLGFTIELDSNSPLFTKVLPFLNDTQHSNRVEMKARVKIYNEFVDKIKQIFNSQDSVTEQGESTQFVKQHYINSITGLQHLQQKFINWKEDKLSVELFEDIAQFSSYVAHLHNTLEYSYINQRNIIPENLLYFNMFVRFSEIRNLTSTESNRDYTRDINPDIISKGNALKYNVTSIVYKLVDCKFDFFESKPFEDTVTQAGIDATFPAASILGLDIYFKSVRRQIFNPLINGAVSFNDGDPALRVVELDNIITKTLRNSTFDTQAFTNSTNKKDSDSIQYTMSIDGKETISNVIPDINKSIKSIQTFNDTFAVKENSSNLLKQYLSDTKTKVMEFAQKEADLLNTQLVNAITQKAALARQLLIQGLKDAILNKDSNTNTQNAFNKTKEENDVKNHNDLLKNKPDGTDSDYYKKLANDVYNKDSKSHGPLGHI